MDNPWATDPWQPRNQDVSWSTPQWPATQRTVWLQDDASLVPSTNATSEHITAQDQQGLPALVATEPNSVTAASVPDHPPARCTSPPQVTSDADVVPEATDAIRRDFASVASVSDGEDPGTVIDPQDADWSIAWATMPSSAINSKETQRADQWEAARQEKEKLNRAVPPELLDTLLHHCQQVSQEIWPAPESNDEDNWKSGFGNHTDTAALLAQLVPTDLTLPPTVQFQATATAKAMNEALKLTRHLPVSARSPLSHLLASKGSLEWEKSIKAKQDIVPDTAHVGWRVLDKEDRLNTAEESKPRKATGGLLSFWNRRASAIQAAPVETPSEQSTSPARSSLESVKSAPHPPSSRASSPSKASIPSVPPPPADSHPTVVATAPASSAVSRFLSRFSRTKGAQHNTLALSSDDLEFLSDLVPSASDPPDEDIDNRALDALSSANNSSSIPPKLPPPVPPPLKHPIMSSRPTSALGALDGMGMIGNISTTPQMQITDHTSNVPVLAPPPSPKFMASFLRTHNLPLPVNDAATPNVASGQSSTSSIYQRLQLHSQTTSRPSFTLPPPQKIPPLLSIPPLLPPPPISPPQTPRPSAFLSTTEPAHSPMMRSTDDSSFHDSHDSDDEFSAFASFPPSAPTSLVSLGPTHSQRSPSPPSPPVRRTYERTHYPSSSTSSIFSPESQTSLDQLCLAGSSISASSDSFDDFVSPPATMRDENKKCTPSPPPLPVKPRLQHQQPSRLEISRVYHSHTPSQTFASPTVHTSLMGNAFSVPSVSDAEHQRTQTLVNHAASRGGVLWPNSPDSDEPRMRTIPPPPSSSTSPKSLIAEEGFDLLGDGDTLGGPLEALPAPLNVVGDFGMGPRVSSLTTDALRVPFRVADGPGKGLHLRDQLQLSPSPKPLFSFEGPIHLAAPNPGSLQPPKPKQTGGLSAQDISFFEGL